MSRESSDGIGGRLAHPESRGTSLELDFVVIGAAKSGTTSLFEYLRTHPALYLPPGKEHAFFSVDQNFVLGWSNYAQRIFAAARPDQLLGKVEPSYMVHSTKVAQRLAGEFPDVKLIAILRDPIQRAISHYRMNERRGHESRALEQAFEEELDAGPATGYVAGGEYGRMIAEFLRFFERSQLLILSSANLRDAPATVLAEIWRFLGVPSHHPANLSRAYQPASGISPVGSERLRRVEVAVRRRASLRAIWHTIPVRTRNSIATRVWERSYRLDQRVVPQARVTPPPPADEVVKESLLTRLREHYVADQELLRSVVGDLPGGIRVSKGEPGEC